MVRSILCAIVLLFSTSAAYAGSLDLDLSSTAQSEFAEFTKQLGTAISYRAVSPAEPLGILGFDLGVEVSTVAIDSDEPFWKNAVAGSDPPGSIIIPRIHAQKGLPFGIDVGLSFTTVPDSDISVIGGELKYAILDGNLAIPAVAVRGTYSQISGVDQLDLSTYGYDISVSKGLAMFTPYVGVGQIFISASANNDIINLKDEDSSVTHGFVGLKFSLLLLNFVGELDVAEVNTYSFRVNVGL